MLRHADELEASPTRHSAAHASHGQGQEELHELVGGRRVEISPEELRRLQGLARGRKRNRLAFFNAGDGLKLRLEARGHTSKRCDQTRCGLCSCHSKSTTRHRTSVKCALCDVSLCTRMPPGLRRSCWDVWHNTTLLQPREIPMRGPGAATGSGVAAGNATGSEVAGGDAGAARMESLSRRPGTSSSEPCRKRTRRR